MALKASGAKVILEIDDKRAVTRSGIDLPVSDNNALVPHAGIIRSIGPNCKNDELEVGMKVFVAKYQGDKLQYEGKDYLIIFEKHILAVADDEYDISIREEDK